MSTIPTLSKLEHNLLSMQVNDIEPLFILYADTKRDLPEFTLDDILYALVKLINLGYSQCIQKNEEENWSQCNNITFNILRNRFQGQSEKESMEYPKHMNEYYFKITDIGREEEAKEIYSQYYPIV
jgi:hypothetical protein